jgi:hypothetical protein
LNLRSVAIWRIALAVVGCGLSAGCPTRVHVPGLPPLPEMDSQLETLEREQDACTKSAVPDPSCQQTKANLLKLANDADAVAAKAADPRMQIAYLRVAGTAAWQAGIEGTALANKTSQQGSDLCTTLDAQAQDNKVFGVPRDCAVLTILPGLVAHGNYLEQMKRIEADPESDAHLQELTNIVANFANDTVLFVHDREDAATRFKGLDDSVKKYVADAEKRMFCNLQVLRRAVLTKDRYRAALKQRVLDEIDRAQAQTNMSLLDC